MRIAVDREVCEGVGMCESMAHRFFEVDDDDVMHVLDETPAAATSCPVQALTLVD